MIDVYYVVSEIASINRRTDMAKFFSYTDAVVHADALRSEESHGTIVIVTRQENESDQHPAHRKGS